MMLFCNCFLLLAIVSLCRANIRDFMIENEADLQRFGLPADDSSSEDFNNEYIDGGDMTFYDECNAMNADGDYVGTYDVEEYVKALLNGGQIDPEVLQNIMTGLTNQYAGNFIDAFSSPYDDDFDTEIYE